jgi:stage V sporulation protein R
MTLPADLFDHQKEIEGFARDFGLDFFPVQFELVDYRLMNQLAAYDGFPVRYPHWRFGMEYERLSKSYSYGLHRIYEMVINNNPCYAYLMTSNKLVDQKLVIAHVYGHCDFFKNNAWFAQTNRRMLDEMANHAARIRRYVRHVGLEAVETFLDVALSLENLIDIHAPAIQRQAALPDAHDGYRTIHRMQANEYMDPYINPPEYLAKQQRKLKEAVKSKRRFPVDPVRDVLLFLLEHAPLENWQRNILDMVREEAHYFAPQKQSKIMNEGWASFVHSQLMTRHILQPDELIDYADHHAGTLATQPGQLNPYKLGLELYRDIEDRWNRGAFGPEYERCDDLNARRNWNRRLGLGRQKLFEVRRIYNDIGFIETFLTEDFARRNKLFTFAYNEKKDTYEIAGRSFQEIKRRLLFQLTNFGQPIIEVTDGNYENRGELYLEHRHEGIDLDIPYAQETLRNLFTIWTRPVHLKTQLKEKGVVVFSIDQDGLTS